MLKSKLQPQAQSLQYRFSKAQFISSPSPTLGFATLTHSCGESNSMGI